MNTVLATFGAKLTERIATRLTGPGLMYVVLCAWAVHSGHDHAFEIAPQMRALNSLTGTESSAPLGLVLQIAILLVAATAAGLSASLIGEVVVGRVWIASKAPKWWRERRRNAWDRRNERRGARVPTRYAPERLTPIGDRFRLVAERVDAQYGLAVPPAWPRLMVLIDADARGVVSEAYERYRADTVLTAWGLLVMPWAIWWWPALPVAAAGLVVGYVRSRSSGETLAVLIESVIDTHQIPLAQSVGIELPAGRLTDAEGPQITNILNKRG